VRRAASLKAKLFIGVVSGAGVLALGYSIYRLALEPVGLDRMLVLIFMTLVTWRAEIWIPGIKSKITLTDTIIFISALLLGPWAAATLASIDGLARSPRSPKNRRAASALLNMAAMNLSVLGSVLLATAIFGSLPWLLADPGHLDRFVLALGLMAAISYALNTGLAAISVALWRRRHAIAIWTEHYMWTWVAFLFGVFAAGLIAKIMATVGFYTVVLSFPALALSYITYKTYLGKVESSDRRIERLTRLHLAIIESLTMAIDAKDPLTRGHIERVRALAEGLARAVGYPEDQMEGLKAAALLHDIGKLAVPEHILNKPGKLSSAEYSKIMIHPVVGADILSNVEFPYEVVPIVKHHHEKYDGTGYPSRLKGEDIPYGARILTVIDCYDALTSNRPQRARYERAEALELMRNEAGRTFDPAILARFLEIVETLDDELSALAARTASMIGLRQAINAPQREESFGPATRGRTEQALHDISAAQREALSLYEISQTLGSSLKIAQVLPIIATRLETIASFTTLVIYLAEEDHLRAAYVVGKNAEALKEMRMAVGEGGAGWVAQKREVLLGGSPLADLERPLGMLAAAYHSTAIFPLLHEDALVGALALYCEENYGYSADEVRLLETISMHAALAVHNALVFERTEESALTDNLTGLPNSRYLYSFFEQERSRAERHGYPLAVMMMDLDGFKQINDTYGHHVGDDILRHIAHIARAQLRSGDILFRYAGDEFVAVLHRPTPEMVADLKIRLQRAVDSFTHEVMPGRMARVGISIGYATYGQDGMAINELMAVADQQMYVDKTARRCDTSELGLAASSSNAK
jgi:diguanylate cyclase (GGDEF)-like protein/putative nucleotidyltransferase with HDIG domain